MRFSSKRIAMILGETQTKARRWVKEFLPADPGKGCRSGKTRRHSINEFFAVYLGGYLVSQMGFTVLEAKIILSDLSSWLENEGFLPVKLPEYKRTDRVGKRVERYEISIMLTNTDLDFFYECRGIIREQVQADGVFKTEYTADRFSGAGVTRIHTFIDHVRILPISSLLQRFYTMLSRNSA